jgi:tetratricopeptide (TPR) repeat protein
MSRYFASINDEEFPSALLPIMKWTTICLLSGCIGLSAALAWAEELRAKQDLPDVPPAVLKSSDLSIVGSTDLGELRSYLGAQRWTEAKEVAEKMVSEHSQESFSHLCLGYVLLRQHENVSAIRSLRHAEKLGSKDPALPKTLGLAYYAINQFVLFRQQMQRNIEMATDDPWPHYYLGLYEATVTENFTAALGHFDQAVAFRPDDAKMTYYRGFCYEMLNQRDLAQKDYEAAIRRLNSSEGSFSLPHQGIARLLADTDSEVALHHAQLAVAQEPGVADNHSILAKIYEQMGRIPEAIQELKAAAEADSTLAAPHYQLYRLLTRQGQKNAASRELAEFQKLKMLYGS